ncbi:unnamed protein product, partial [Candidula unifasciata]
QISSMSVSSASSNASPCLLAVVLPHSPSLALKSPNVMVLLNSMALTRPQLPEKPPVAAKPRFKPPLLPPKPSASLFILSPPSTTKASSINNNTYKPQKSETGKKAAVPPPIPKNPPRAGVLKKSRSLSARLSQEVETTPASAASHQDSQSVSLSCGNTGDSKGKTADYDLRHSFRADSQQSTRDKVQKLLQRHQHTLASGSNRSNTSTQAVGTNTRPVPVTTSITDSQFRDQHSKTLPKPKLRSASALWSSLEPDITSSKFRTVNSSKPDRNKLDNISVPQNTKLNFSTVRKSELGYKEVFRGDTGVDTHPHCTGRVLSCELGKGGQSQNTAEVSVQSGKEPKEVDGRGFPQYNAKPETSDDFPSLLRDQPEDTCDMLKEIEELLKTKLGCLEFDEEHKDTTEAIIDSCDDVCKQNCEPSSGPNRVISLVGSVPKPSQCESSSSGPPRLGLKVGECSNLRNFGSGARAADGFTGDFPHHQTLAESTKVTSGPDRKVSPPKPKRTFTHCASNVPYPVSVHQPVREEGIPFSDHTDILEKNQLVDSDPPPLPPRNKPRSVSLREIVETDSSSPKRSSPLAIESCVTIHSQTRDTKIPDPSPAQLQQTAQPGTQLISPARKASKSRLSRESLPPPPPGPPRRAATFSPGDSRLPGQRSMQRKAKKVLFIAKEIVSSESTFVDVLRLLNVDFRVHISKSGEQCNHPIVPAETMNKILDFLPQLQNLNEDLLKDLSERVEHWDVNPRLADVFVKKGPFLKLYTSYIRNFENATTALEEACKRNSAFAAAVKEFEMSSRCARLALKHYMLKPIQRIPQYKLLLQDYLKHLAQDSPDYKDTINALSIVSEVAEHANNSMRQGDHLQKLLEVQRSLVGQFEVIQPGRVLIKQGELQKLSRREMQPRMFFLFSDVLLYTTPTSIGYKINNILSLTGMKINSPNLEHYKFEFNIISVQRSFTLCA